ncbi:uncharacterized protein MYCFIDRAFT_179292 [Pseudocercospora fijiensis CIRAD86]|uniref:Uncharacterized protein n=1 Tax=Pseudocercospora fijiensis (strain CIRAD86) TaxID=383855 RepID=M3AKZ3_PSEFD|nr:uncharacterized protein MYCFIDRAFT_179292 [Pseudocercospora fijiensis CIRAD86]EME77808.1 hypothetical protein MYCFIDRAFT_179292 [Pseudocercospora fijiensis CIRAD86]
MNPSTSILHVRKSGIVSSHESLGTWRLAVLKDSRESRRERRAWAKSLGILFLLAWKLKFERIVDGLF